MSEIVEYLFLLPAAMSAHAAIMLAVRRHRTEPQLLLSVAFAVTAMTMTCTVLYHLDIWSTSPVMDLLTIAASLLSAPCYYLYVVSLTHPEGLGRKHLLIFLPAIVMTLLNFIADLILGWDGVRELLRLQHSAAVSVADIPGAMLFKTVMDSNCFRIVAFILTVWVFEYAYKSFREYDSLLDEYYSDSGVAFLSYDDMMKWSLAFMVGAMMVMCVVPFSISGRYLLTTAFMCILLTASMCLILYAGLHMFSTAEEITRQISAASRTCHELPPSGFAAGGTEFDEHMRGYRLEIQKGLEKFVENKGYLDPSINVSQLSQDLCTNRVYMADTLRVVYGMSFSEFVNKLRVEYSKQVMLRMSLGESMKKVAIESGYNSFTNFYRNFMKYEGCSPTEWRQKARQG